MKKKHVVARKLAATYCYKKNKQTMAKPLKVFFKRLWKDNSDNLNFLFFSYQYQIQSTIPTLLLTIPK
jgi:hypothetical protein